MSIEFVLLIAHFQKWNLYTVATVKLRHYTGSKNRCNLENGAVWRLQFGSGYCITRLCNLTPIPCLLSFILMDELYIFGRFVIWSFFTSITPKYALRLQIWLINFNDLFDRRLMNAYFCRGLKIFVSAYFFAWP